MGIPEGAGDGAGDGGGDDAGDGVGDGVGDELEGAVAGEDEPADDVAAAGIEAEADDDDGGLAEEPAEEPPPHEAHVSAARITITDLIAASPLILFPSYGCGIAALLKLCT